MISVCIPTYNRYKTIKYTIESVISQSYKRWELVIIDDSENDKTKEEIQNILNKDERVKYVRNVKRLGLVKNWNKCIKLSKYDYVLILHHDDYLLPGVLEDYAKYIKKNNKFGLLHSNCKYVKMPYLNIKNGYTQEKSILKEGDDAVLKILFNNNIACSTVLVKKECYNKLGFFDEEAWMSPDWEMWARIGQFYPIAHINKYGAAVILDSNNTHLSNLDISEFIKQQKYYSEKIKSYLSDELRYDTYLCNKIEENFKLTVLNLAFQHLSRLNIYRSFKFFRIISYSRYDIIFFQTIKYVIIKMINIFRKKHKLTDVYSQLLKNQC